MIFINRLRLKRVEIHINNFFTQHFESKKGAKNQLKFIKAQAFKTITHFVL